MIAHEPDISEDTVRKIVVEDLGRKKKGERERERESLRALCTACIDCRTGKPS